MKRIQKTLKSWIETDLKHFIRTLALSLGFGFSLCISFIFGYLSDRYGGVSKHLLTALFAGIITGCLMGGAIMMLWALWASKNGSVPGTSTGSYGLKTEEPVKSLSIKLWVTSSIGILLCWSVIWLSFYPALFSYDGETQISQMITGEFNTHHPLLHTLLLGGCLKLMYTRAGMNGAMALYALIQMVIMAGILGYIIARAAGIRAKTLMLVLYGMFAAFFPVNPILAISTTKDVIFAGLMACFSMEIMVGDGCRRRQGIGITVCAALMIAFRNNAIYAVLLMLAILCTDRIIRRESIISDTLIRRIFMGILCGALITGGLRLALNAESGSPREALSIPIQQMARVRALEGDRLDGETLKALDELLSPEADRLYNPHLADPVKRVVNLKNPRLFVSTWLKLGVRHPGIYLDAWILTTEGAWYIYDTSVNSIYGNGVGTGFGYLSTDTRTMPEGFEVIRHSLIPSVTSFTEQLVNGNSFEKIPVIRLLFSPAFYAWIVFGCLYVGMVRGKRSYVSGLLLPLTYYFTILCGPAILVRYMYPYMIVPALIFVGHDNN